VSHRIAERLRSSNPDERVAACRDAVEDPSAVVLIDALAAALGDPVKGVARAASDALARLAHKVDGVVPAVRSALRSDDSSRRWHAALTSARIEPPSSRLLPAIVEALANREGDVRWKAAQLLVEAGRVNPEFLPLAIGLVANGEPPIVRSMAAHCVRELGADSPESARALLEATRDPERSVRRAALTALAGLAQPSRDASLARLEEIARADPDPELRALAGRALEGLARSEPAAG